MMKSKPLRAEAAEDLLGVGALGHELDVGGVGVGDVLADVLEALVVGLAPAAVVVRPDQDHGDVELALDDVGDLGGAGGAGRAGSGTVGAGSARGGAAGAAATGSEDEDARREQRQRPETNGGHACSPHSGARRRPSNKRHPRPPRRASGDADHPGPGPCSRWAKDSRRASGSVGHSAAMGYHPRVFERTELPAGPRVISARMPGARSVSIAAYVLAGSRLETDVEAGVAHFMEHITFKGTTAYPSTRAISEAIEGVGGSFNAATDRESTVYWVRRPEPRGRPGDGCRRRAHRPSGPVRSTTSIPSGRSSSRRSGRTSTTRPSTARSCSRARCSGTGRWVARSAATRPGIRALPTDTIRDFWRTTYRPANTVIAVAGDLAHDQLVDLASAAFGTGNGPIPTFAPAPTLPAGPRAALGKRQTSQAQLVVGVPALRRDHPDAWTLAVLNAVLGDGMSSRLFLSVREARGLAYDVSSGLVDYADAGALEISAGVDPAELAPALEAILAELVRLRDELVPEAELEKAKRYLAGGMELRMDDTRHVASWIGGQEALHDRVLDLDEALAAVDAVDAGVHPAPGRGAVPGRPAAPGGGRAGPPPARPRGPPAPAGMTDTEPTVRARAGRSAHDRPHPGPAPPADGVARPGPGRVRDAGRPGTLDDEALVDLADVRWRTGDLAGAGSAATTALDRGIAAPVAMIIAAESAFALGRPGEARRLATRAMTAAGGTLDALFAGMPRSSVWPSDPGRAGPVRRDPLRRRRRWRRGRARSSRSAATRTAAGPRPGRCPPRRPGSPRRRPVRRRPACGMAMPSWRRRSRDRRPGRPRCSRPAAQAISSGEPDRAAALLGVAMRVGPHLAPSIVDATMDAETPALLVVRGDALLATGHATRVGRRLCRRRGRPRDRRPGRGT